MTLHKFILVFLVSTPLLLAAQSKTSEQSTSKETSVQKDVPKSIAESVAVAMQLTEHSLMSLAETMP